MLRILDLPRRQSRTVKTTSVHVFFLRAPIGRRSLLLTRISPAPMNPTRCCSDQEIGIGVSKGSRAMALPVDLIHAAMADGSRTSPARRGRVPTAWSQHELRKFRQLEAYLRQTGVNSQVEYGLGDEGHPWCVFCCAESAAVLAHFARMIRTNQLGSVIDRFAQISANRLVVSTVTDQSSIP
jgi:hypothetical protein